LWIWKKIKEIFWLNQANENHRNFIGNLARLDSWGLDEEEGGELEGFAEKVFFIIFLERDRLTLLKK